MEFKKVNEEIQRLSILQRNKFLTANGVDLVEELKTLLEQRNEMLEMLKKCSLFVEHSNTHRAFKIEDFKNEIEQLIKKATEI